MKQTVQDFGVTIIDDASTMPEMGGVALAYLARFPHWKFERNFDNMKAPYTIMQGIEMSEMDDDDVVFLCDGDDFLLDTAVERIQNVYARYPDLWLTYGSYQPYPDWTTEPHPSEYPTLVRREREFRRDIQRFNHPLTFRKFLWDALDDADLQDDDGEWFTDGYDQVIMLPMLEMAAPDHYAFLDEVIYYYNAENPISESRLIEEEKLVPRAHQVLARPKKEQLIR